GDGGVHDEDRPALSRRAALRGAREDAGRPRVRARGLRESEAGLSPADAGEHREGAESEEAPRITRHAARAAACPQSSMLRAPHRPQRTSAARTQERMARPTTLSPPRIASLRF